MLKEYEKRKVILKAKCSSSITAGETIRALQEIANIVNVGNSGKRDINKMHKTWDNICATAKTGLFLSSEPKTNRLLILVYNYFN